MNDFTSTHPQPFKIKRFTTAFDENGKSVFVSKGKVGREVKLAITPTIFTINWATSAEPKTPVFGCKDDPTVSDPLPSYVPAPNETRFGVFTIPPESVKENWVGMQKVGMTAAINEINDKLPGIYKMKRGATKGMHSTRTIDYGTVISGKVILELDSGEQQTLQSGDCFVQNATMHAWKNPFEETCVISIVSVGVQDIDSTDFTVGALSTSEEELKTRREHCDLLDKERDDIAVKAKEEQKLKAKPEFITKQIQQFVESTQTKVDAVNAKLQEDAQLIASGKAEFGFSQQPLSLEQLKQVCEAVKSSNKLERLVFSFCNLEEEEKLQEIANAIASNTSIKALSLEGNAIGDVGLQILSEAIKVNTCLEVLDLRKTSVGAAGAKALAMALEENKHCSLTAIGLWENDIEIDGATALCKAATCKHSKLSSLDLRQNNIGKCSYPIGALLPATKLERIDLRKNYLGDAGVTSFATALAAATTEKLTLKYLNLGDNGVSDVGAKDIAKLLTLKNLELEMLELRRNKIGPDGTFLIARALTPKTNKSSTICGSVTSLTYLDLSFNQIKVAGARHIAEMMNSNQVLTFIDMCDMFIPRNELAFTAMRAEENRIFKDTTEKEEDPFLTEQEKEELAQYPHTLDYEFSDEDLQHLKDEGYVVLHDVVEPSLCDEIKNEIFEKAKEKCGVDPNNPQTWHTLIKKNGTLHTTHLKSLYKLRQHPKMYSLWCQLHRRHDLTADLNVVSLKIPKQHEYVDADGNKQIWTSEFCNKLALHHDLDILDIRRIRYQASMVLQDCAEDGGSTTVIPGFHKLERFNQYRKDLFSGKLNKNVNEKTYGGGFAHPGRYGSAFQDMEAAKLEKKLALKKGDVLIWSARLPHGNSENLTNQWRISCFPTFSPANSALAPHFRKYRAEVKECVNNGKFTTTYAHGLPTASLNSEYMDWECDNHQSPVPFLTPLGRKLLGQDEWN